jgi:hypothetical protein
MNRESGLNSHQQLVQRMKPARGLLFMTAFLALAPLVIAQTTTGGGKTDSTLPDAPVPQNTAATFIGYATNGSFVFPDIATSSGPLTVGGKFKLFVNQSISPPYMLVSAFSAAINQARNVPEGYGQGWDAYGSRFGSNMARASSNSFFSTFVLGSLLHQDPRFFPQNKPSFWGSVKYSAQRVIVTRNDSGNAVFNASGIVGTLAAETLANTYLPVEEQTGAKTLTRFGADLGWQVGGNMFKNYWPTLFHNMGLNRLKVIPDPGKPSNQAH